MSFSDVDRLSAQRLSPRILRLWRSLAPLKSVISFMNTGAHPDDETSAMLAAMSWRDGIDISYVCSTRGEGGQNNTGTESGAALGVLRTAEMEAACDVLGLRMYWLGYAPDDPVSDFGFSKSGEETLEKWGHALTLQRFVTAIRQERPDVLCPTFLDVPGQHGHHRAMTRAVSEAFDLAADPEYISGNLAPWAASKLYLPAWSGAGDAYDDDLPPPPVTLLYAARGIDPVSGWSYEQIGQQSRLFHATQGLGRWVSPGKERDWPLHLLKSRVAGPDDTFEAGLPGALADLSDGTDTGALADADRAIAAAISAFPLAEQVTAHAVTALRALQNAQVAAQHHHRIIRKREQLREVIATAAGVEVFARFSAGEVRPGESAGYRIETREGQARGLKVTPLLPAGWQAEAGEAEKAETGRGLVTLSAEAELSDPYPPVYLPGLPQAPCVKVEFEVNGQQITLNRPFENPPLVLPVVSAGFTPGKAVLNRLGARQSLDIMISDVTPAGAVPSFDLPQGWQATPIANGLRITGPEGGSADRLETLQLRLDGVPAQCVTRVRTPTGTWRALIEPAVLKVLHFNCAVPNSRIGVIDAGLDHVHAWLGAAGCDVRQLSDAELVSDAAFAAYDTLVIGVYALRFRDGLVAQMPRIRAWVEAGGTLVTLCHRPWDFWDANETPPRFLEIGKPSLRWRVTDENATVTMAEPHEVLNTPNRIGETDWDGWHKERGLYFAKDWAAEYIAPLSMHDPDEAPLRGGLLIGDIGKGRHIHTSLNLHHQLAMLTPGAFRLMMNLLAHAV